MATRAKPDPSALLDLHQTLSTRTPARLFVGRAGPAYRTVTQLALRQDHAAAKDAVQAELNLLRDFERDFIDRWELFAVSTYATSKADYLLHPEKGRRLSDAAREEIARRCSEQADLQVVIGDGLSVAAVITQAPVVLDTLMREAEGVGWRCGQPFVIRHCRVGVLNDIGELLDPEVVVLLIGERPGLATAESLSAYLAYRPRAGHTDAERNLISNIHARGVAPALAAGRIMQLAKRLRQLQLSGVAVKEEGAASGALPTYEENPLLPETRQTRYTPPDA